MNVGSIRTGMSSAVRGFAKAGKKELNSAVNTSQQAIYKSVPHSNTMYNVTEKYYRNFYRN